MTRAAVVVACLAGIFSSARAQEPKKQEDKKTVITADYLKSVPDGERKLTYLAGNATVKRGDVEIRADRILTWSGAGKGGLEGDVEEIYAEGHIVYRRGGKQLKVERLYFSVKDDRAFALHVHARGHDPVLGINFQIMAEEAREIAKGVFEARDISITTCEYGLPHYDVVMKRGTMTGTKPRTQAGPFDPFPFDEWDVKGENITPRLIGVPFLFIPGLAFSSDLLSDFPLKSVKGGRSSRFGYFLLSELGFKIKKGRMDRIVPWENETEEDDHRTWGEIILQGDWRSERGGATGVDFKWEWEDYHGYVDTYYLHDNGRSTVGFDQKFPALERPERARIRAFHRHDVSDFWRYELELSWIADRSLLEEFFPKEFKEGKEQETALYARWRDGNMGAFAYERHRLNDFQTQVEFLPKLSFELLQEPVVPEITDRLLLTHSVSLAHLRFSSDDEAHLPEDRLWRLDALNELSLPIDLSVVQISPFGSLRATTFGHDLAGHTAQRYLWTAGGRLRTQIHGVHDLTWEAIGLRRLRHILEIEARYANNVENNVPADDLFTFDEVDRLDEFEEVAFEVRNRFQTKILEGEKLVTWEFLNVGAQVEYYPDSDRDTVSNLPTNFEPPFNWISLAPREPTVPLERRHWSNIHWDLELRPRSFFAVAASGEYNPVDRQEEVRQWAVGVTPVPWLAASAGASYFKHVTNTYGGSITLTLSEKWSASVEVNYDFRVDEFTSRRFILGRDFHDFIVQAVYEIDDLRDDRRFYVSLVPKFLGKGGRSFFADVRRWEP